MELSENQEKIAGAIRILCTSEPICTAADIAEQTGLTKRAVLNNVEPVIESFDDIETRRVGQANIYYVKDDRFDDIWTNETQDVIRIFHPTEAGYAELRQAPAESDFDLIVHWYDSDAEELEGYRPSDQEVGRATGVYGDQPVAIRAFESIKETEQD